MKFSSIEELFKQLIPAEDQAQLVIYHQGKKVVDTSVGIEPDKLIAIYSVSKALCALAIANLVQNGKLDLAKRVNRSEEHTSELQSHSLSRMPSSA